MSRLGTIQVLRAIAALMVALGHLQHEALTLATAKTTGFSPVFLGLSGVGVDLFFVISGFVMVFGSRKLFGEPGAATTFMARRVARIVPLYWLMTTLFVMALLLSPGALTTALPDLSEIVKSYLFLPYQPAAGGIIQPVYKLGWTLNYEMFFYFCFALTLAFRPRVAVLSIAAIFLMFAALGQIIGPLPAILRFWSDPIILEFVLGALIGLAYCEGRRITPRAGPLLMVAGLLLLLAGDWAGLSPTGALRPLIWGLPAAMILAGAALGRRADVEGPSAAPTFMERLGDASYALYLLHPLVIRALRLVWDKTGFSANLDPWMFVGLGAAILIPVSILVHSFIEKPVTAWAQRRLVRSPAPANAQMQARMAAILGRQASNLGKTA